MLAMEDNHREIKNEENSETEVDLFAKLMQITSELTIG